MAPRDTEQAHRVSTPLELLFDLTFVVAVSQAADELGRSIAGGHVGHALFGYLTVFFAIWWAWMNFTWFASAYDTDDVPYRLLTLLQMAGVLVLAAGVPEAFERQAFGVVTLGYVVMRLAMLAQWSRAARWDVAHRSTAVRFAVGIAVVQLGWVLRLLTTGVWATVTLLALIAADVSVPLWAERRTQSTWHPHHIAERYGLFTIIVLGECVLAATVSVQSAFSAAGWSLDLLLVGLGALVLLFALWWIYFLVPAGEGLERRRDLGFLWGYGHYFVFASLAALGAGLAVAGEAITEHLEASPTLVGLSVAVPVVVFLLLVWLLHRPMGAQVLSGGPVLAAAAGTLTVAGVVVAGLPLSWAVALMPLPAVVLVARAVVIQTRPPHPDGP
jgi:low temperature requirement protein LtrA